MPIYEHEGHRFRNREDAGRVLASRLSNYNDTDLIVLAIPNGGVPVARVIAEDLHKDLFLMIVRKLQVPDNPEAGFGAVTCDGLVILNQNLVKYLGLTDKDIQLQKEKALESIRSRRKFFGTWAEIPELKDRTIVLVDDGLASGFTMEAALKSLENRQVRSTIVAVPTASMTAHRRLETMTDKIICPELGRLRIFAVADAYENWYDLDENETLKCLDGFYQEKGRQNENRNRF